MVFAMRVLDPEVTEQQVQNMSEEEIEKDLTLLGVSGLADKL